MWKIGGRRSEVRGCPRNRGSDWNARRCCASVTGKPAVRFTSRYGSVFQNSRKRLFLLLPSMASSFQFLALNAFPLFLIS